MAFFSGSLKGVEVLFFSMQTDNEYNFALFSGGDDSLAMTHYVMQRDEWPVDCVVYLDTGIGLDENREYVEDVCDEYGWELEVAETPQNYTEIVKEHGFPGPESHTYMYILLKERAIRQVNTKDEYYGTRCGLYTGVRKDESRRRMGHVDQKHEGKMFDWYAPIFDKSNEWVEEYRQKHDLPENPAHKKIHRSGDCFCGAYAKRDEELIDLQAHYPEMYEELMEIEEEVQDSLGASNPHAWWGHKGKDEFELHEDMETVGEGILCSSCGVPADHDEDHGNLFEY